MLAWDGISGAMSMSNGGPLWTAYLPTAPVKQRADTVEFCPDYTAREAKGIDWGALIRLLEPQVKTEACQNAQVVVILSDNRTPENIPHWEYTSRIMVERSKNMKKERFYFMWIPADQTTGLNERQYIWTIAAVAKALTCNPLLDAKHLLFMDHDATMLTLVEMSELIQESIQAYAAAINAIQAEAENYIQASSRSPRTTSIIMEASSFFQIRETLPGLTQIPHSAREKGGRTAWILRQRPSS